MKLIKSLVILLLLGSSLCAQSTVKHGTYLHADTASLQVVPDGVRVFVTGLKDTRQNVALIVTPHEAKRTLVRAYDRAKPFPPKTLQSPENDGVFVLDLPGVFDVEILAIDAEGNWLPPEYLEGVSVEGATTEPDQPIDDYSELAEKALALAKEVDDPERAKEYVAALKNVDFSGELADVKARVGNVRREMFVGVVRRPWYKFFQPMDAELGEATTTEQYAAMWNAILVGLESSYQSQESAPAVNQAWQPPPQPWLIGQIHNGKRYLLVCYQDGTCGYEWK